MTGSSNMVVGEFDRGWCCAFHNTEPLTDAQKHRTVGELPVMRMRITRRLISDPDAVAEPHEPPDRSAATPAHMWGPAGRTAVTGGSTRARTPTERR